MCRFSTYLLVALALLFFAPSSHAQLIRYGIKGGTNLTIITKGGDFFESVKPAPGFQAGVYAKLRPAKILRFQAEAMYVQNAFNSILQTDTVEQGGEAIYSRKIELKQQNAYINIPVMMYVKVYKGLDLSFGPQVAFLTKAVATGQETYAALQAGKQDSLANVTYNYLKDQAGQGAYANDSTLSQGKFFNPASFDINLGASLNLSQAIKFEIRTNYGLLSAINDYYKAGFDLKKINRTIGAQASLSIEFGKKKKD